MDLDFSSSVLDTPSLITPNVNLNPMIYKIPRENSIIDVNNDNNNNVSSNTVSRTTTTITNNESPTEMKLSKIKDDLKQSFTQPRRPTESIFQKMAKAGVLTIENASTPPTLDSGLPVDVPSTADVMNDIESFAKYSTQDTAERETATILTVDNSHFDTTTLHHMGFIVSPKKKLLIRSQSHTEPTSPSSVSTNQLSQSQRSNVDDSTSTDDDHSTSTNSDFQRMSDVSILVHPVDSKSQLDGTIKSSYTIQLQTDQNAVHSTVIKQQPIIPNTKRNYQQAIIGTTLSKANSLLSSQQPVSNEVTSSSPSIGSKRHKANSISATNTTATSSYSSATNDHNASPDDQRKKQIRDSNREAARRCRERRRQYIEQLEGNLEQCKLQIKQLNEKLSIAERENTQLRAILTEAKLFHPMSGLSSTDSIVDFVNVITTNGNDLTTDSTDGAALQRSYYTRSTH